VSGSRLPRPLQLAIKHPAVIALLLFLFALCFRMPATNYGLPYMHYWDEPSYIKLSLQMMKSGNFDHEWYNIPPFFLYQHTLAQTAHFLDTSKEFPYPLEEYSIDVDKREVSKPAILQWSRGWSAMLGAAVCALIFLVLRQIISDPLAILAGLVFALMPGAIEQSILVTADMPLTLMTLLTLGATLQIKQQEQAWLCLTAGLLAGLATATKYNGLIVLVTPMVHLAARRDGTVMHWLVLIKGWAAGFTLGFPYWLTKFPQFISGFGWEMYHYNTQFEMAGVSNLYGLDYLYYLLMFGMGPVLFIALIVGLAVWLRHPHDTPVLTLLSFPVVYSAWLLSQSSDFPRNLAPLFPWFAWWAAVGLGWGWRLLGRFKLTAHNQSLKISLAAVIALLVILPSTLYSYRLASFIEPRTTLMQWANTNLDETHVLAIPQDLHIRTQALSNSNATIILLARSDLHEQTLTGATHIFAGKNPPETEPALQGWIDRQQPEYVIDNPRVYPPASSLGRLYVGKWMLGSFSVNPSVFIAGTNKFDGEWTAPSEEIVNLDKFHWEPHKFNQTLQGNPLQLGNLQYPFGIGVHGGSELRIKVPPNAQRFVVDAGMAHDLSQTVAPTALVKIQIGEAQYHSPELSKGSAIWRVDAPVGNANEVIIRITDPEEDYIADHITLGYCGFTQTR